jgi:hypothetical protein
VYQGQFDPAHQVQDFSPGITPSGLFWTVPVRRGTTRIDLHHATAAMRGDAVVIPDYHDIVNAVGLASPPIPTVPGTVSWRMRWTGSGPAQTLTDPTFHFTGTFIPCTAHVDWSVEEPAKHFRYVSSPDGQATVTSATGSPAVIGFERNGVFFS